jgi:hypothetical protein
LARPARGGRVGAEDAPYGVADLSLYLLDTTVLIAHLRGNEAATDLLLNVGDFPMRDLRVKPLPP